MATPMTKYQWIIAEVALEIQLSNRIGDKSAIGKTNDKSLFFRLKLRKMRVFDYICSETSFRALNRELRNKTSGDGSNPFSRLFFI